jgi:hypothetical protein
LIPGLLIGLIYYKRIKPGLGRWSVIMAVRHQGIIAGRAKSLNLSALQTFAYYIQG